MFGGKVKADPNQAETGTFSVRINKNGKKSLIFKKIPDSFYVILGHKNSVTKLPKGAKVIASTRRCKYQAYQIGNSIYSVQFHAELNKTDMKFRLSLYPSYAKDGKIEKVMSGFNEIPNATKVLKNFRKIVSETTISSPSTLSHQQPRNYRADYRAEKKILIG